MEAKEDYLDLTTREFLATHSVCGLLGTICNFRSRPNQKLINFKVHYSNAKNWQRKISLISRDGWKYPCLEAHDSEFPVCANLQWFLKMPQSK